MRVSLLVAALMSIASCAPPPADFVALLAPPAAPPRLSLNNFTFDRAHVIVAVVASGAECATIGAGVIAATDFTLPRNGSRVIEAPPGADVCWHRDLAADTNLSDAVVLKSRWNRAFLSSGGSIDRGL
jgi:hypothetical protein